MRRDEVTVLAIIDEPYRGCTERGYADWVYLARVLNVQLGRMDLLLRGEAVFTALRPIEPDSGPQVAALIDDGIGVLVNESDLNRHGLQTADLLDGITVVTIDSAEPSWPGYSAVWFL